MSLEKSHYSIIRKPLITEKAAVFGADSNSVAFEVSPKANKVEIKKAIEQIFDVKVSSVKTLNYKGKIKKVGRHIGSKKAWKKAYVLLEEGHSIDLIEGL